MAESSRKQYLFSRKRDFSLRARAVHPYCIALAVRARTFVPAMFLFSPAVHLGIMLLYFTFILFFSFLFFLAARPPVRREDARNTCFLFSWLFSIFLAPLYSARFLHLGSYLSLFSFLCVLASNLTQLSGASRGVELAQFSYFNTECEYCKTRRCGHIYVYVACRAERELKPSRPPLCHHKLATGRRAWERT